MSRKHVLHALGAVIALVAASPAFADAIDGSWCHADGRRMSINGPSIVTPGNNRLEGQYTRHSFVYFVPAPEAPAGATVNMRLLGETAVNVQVGDAPPTIWNRCGPPIT